METEERFEDAGLGDWSEGHKPRNAGSPQEWERGEESPKGVGLCRHLGFSLVILILDLWPPKP